MTNQAANLVVYYLATQEMPGQHNRGGELQNVAVNAIEVTGSLFPTIQLMLLVLGWMSMETTSISVTTTHSFQRMN